MNTDSISDFLGTKQDGSVSKIEPDTRDAVYKKSDTILTDAPQATEFAPRADKIAEVNDDGDVLGETVEHATTSKAALPSKV